MKVIHIDSGLGNQMLSYCEYLALRKANPNEQFYIENFIYDIPECNEVTCQWNGYELERVFGINSPENLKTIIPEEDLKIFMSYVRESHFWDKNMNFPKYFTEGFKKIGLNLTNTFGDFEAPELMAIHHPDTTSLSYKLKHAVKRSLPYLYLQMWKKRKPIPASQLDCRDSLFIKTDENLFAGQKLKFKFKGSGIELIEDEVRRCFAFPAIADEKNASEYDYIKSHNAVAIHARRGDMLGLNYPCYVTGYFRRAVRFIRKHTDNPIFYIFCDPGSVQWAKDNPRTFGLDFEKDEVHFVDWNKKEDSYRDMQLMAACKHQIITNSTFGWWGAFLNSFPGKITISPHFEINTTHIL